MSDTARKYWSDPDLLGRAVYVERPEAKVSAIDGMLAALHARWRARMPGYERLDQRFVGAVGARQGELKALDDASLRAAAGRLRPRLLHDGFTEPNVIEAFALGCEATRRSLGFTQRSVQMQGARLLLEGALLEMATGEGKTVTAVLAAAAAALAGLRVHVVTVNDYLAERDCKELSPILNRLGISVGLVVNGMSQADKRQAYRADVVYVNNKEITFDYLRDLLALGGRRTRSRASLLAAIGDVGRAAAIPELTLRGLDFAIVDEADSVLIDEAKTPLIISSESDRPDAVEDYERALQLAHEMIEGTDFEIVSRDRAVRLTDAGRARIATATAGLPGLWAVRRARDDRVAQALSALYLFQREVHYIIAEDKVQIVDEFTGRVMPDRSWEAGLHQMIEVKEGLPITGRRTTIARITYQRFFQRYRRLGGMTGTAREVADEMSSQYALHTRRVRTHKPVQRRFQGITLERDGPAKWRAVRAAVAREHARGRPVLIGVRSVKDSQELSEALTASGIAHQVLNARQDAEEAAIVGRAGQPSAVTVATNMAGRGTDIKLGAGVAALGGLHVILTEFHESPRIDRQLYGRAGRQGDPGSCEAIIALTDEIFELHARPARDLLARLSERATPGAVRRLATLVQRLAQGNAERNNRAIRRLTLEQDRRLARDMSFAGRAE